MAHLCSARTPTYIAQFLIQAQNIYALVKPLSSVWEVVKYHLSSSFFWYAQTLLCSVDTILCSSSQELTPDYS